jgi:hypothetical protein
VVGLEQTIRLIAAGIGFAVTLAVLPPSIAFVQPIAARVLLLAWGVGGMVAGVVDLKIGTALGLSDACHAPVRIRAGSQPTTGLANEAVEQAREILKREWQVTKRFPLFR